MFAAWSKRHGSGNFSIPIKSSQISIQVSEAYKGLLDSVYHAGLGYGPNYDTNCSLLPTFRYKCCLRRPG